MTSTFHPHSLLVQALIAGSVRQGMLGSISYPHVLGCISPETTQQQNPSAPTGTASPAAVLIKGTAKGSLEKSVGCALLKGLSGYKTLTGMMIPIF